MNRIFPLAALWLMIAPAAAWAHGISLGVTPESGGWVAEAHYDSGRPIAEAEVVLYPSTDPDDLRTLGRTDADGRCVLAPGAPGEWTVRVDDGRGHRASRTFIVAADGAAGDHPAPGHDHPHAHRLPLAGLLAGVGLLAAAGAAGYWLLGRARPAV